MISCEEGATAGGFLIGDLVKYDAAGQVVIATSGAVAGIALQNASGTQATKILIEEITPDTKYVAVYKASATAQALVGDLVDFTFGAGGHTLDETGATTDAYVVGFKDAVGTTSGKLIIKFLFSVFANTH
jgi:hypothetical protein